MMKRMRQVTVGLLVVFALALPGNSCGPFDTIAAFVRSSGPDVAYADYVKGNVGIPQTGYRLRHLVVAYDWWNGHGLNASEQAQAVAHDAFLNAVEEIGEKPGPGMTAWVQAGGTVKSTDRPVPDEDYESFSNCLDGAFETAARTWTARRAAHSGDSASLTNWMQGQNAVFANCDANKEMPEPVAAGAPMWLRQDRAYQIAAAKFYQADFDGAIAQLRSVAADTGSPWHDTARLVIARAMIRRATLGNVDPAAPAEVKTPGFPPRISYAEMRKRQDALKAERPKRLAEARDELRGILADPKLAAVHPSAQRLLDFVMARLDPAGQTKVLAARVSGPARPQGDRVFGQALMDLHVIGMTSPVPPRVMSAADRNFGLTEWLSAMQQTAGDQKAAETSLAGWRSTHETAWLVAALAAVKPGDAAVPELLRAAAEVPDGSPAWLALKYNRLRLTLKDSGTRTELDGLPAPVSRNGSRSTINLFQMLKQESSPTLGAFLQSAGSLPSVVYLDDSMDDGPMAVELKAPELCGVSGAAYAVMLFNHDAATFLNARMPLTMLADAAGGPLPGNLKFQVAQATWTRAVLLKRPEIAKRMTPILVGCYPAWKPWLEKYDGATTDKDREANGLLALMRFASTEPVVRDGWQRSEGFAAYSEYRDNWWQESHVAKSQTRFPGGVVIQETPATFFGNVLASVEELPNPPFLSGESQMQANQEVAALRAIPCASDYFARAALDWQKANPADARTPDILGFAERVVRNGCRTDATSGLNHELFTVVQTRYSKSEWARKYTTWE